MKLPILAAVLAVTALLWPAPRPDAGLWPAIAQAEDETGTTDELDLPALMQRPFTEDEARRAVDTYGALTEKYKQEDMRAASEGGDFLGVLKSAGLVEQVKTDVAAHGFQSIEDFTRTLIGVTLSAAFVQEGQDITEINKQIKEMEDDPNMPAELKTATLGMLKAMLPLDANIEIMRKLLADEAYKAKLQKLLEPDDISPE